MKKKNPKYTFVGWTSPTDRKDLIETIILKDNASNGRFCASVLEAQKLVQNGELILPDVNEHKLITH